MPFPLAFPLNPFFFPLLNSVNIHRVILHAVVVYPHLFENLRCCPVRGRLLLCGHGITYALVRRVLAHGELQVLSENLRAASKQSRHFQVVVQLVLAHLLIVLHEVFQGKWSFQRLPFFKRWELQCPLPRLGLELSAQVLPRSEAVVANYCSDYPQRPPFGVGHQGTVEPLCPCLFCTQVVLHPSLIL